MLDRIKHAFAVDTAGSPPTPEQRALLDRLAREIVRREMATPALLFLEMARPVNYLGAQALHYFAPLVTTLVDAGSYEQFAEFLARRDAIEILISAISEQQQADR